MFEPHFTSPDATSSAHQHLQAGLRLPPEFASTPDVDVDVGYPSPETAGLRRFSASSPEDTAGATLLDVSLPQPFPLPSTSPQPLLSPIYDDRPQFDLTFPGLPSTNVSLPTPTLLRTAHNLRLPSFDALGIAAPHPDRFPLQTTSSFSSLGAGPLSKPEDPLHALSPPLAFHLPGVSSATSPRPAKTHLEHLVSTFTPPSEPGTINWGSCVNVRTAALGSPPGSDPGVSPNLYATASASAPGQAPIIVPTPAVPNNAESMAGWLDGVKDVITTESACLNFDTVKILSHALPCPSLTGHAFGQIIATIHDRMSVHTQWINVFHALPGRYTLSDLPKSPPSTPGPAVGGDSYFTSKVFDSAVVIPDYQLSSRLLPPSPRPVVPPGSIDISVVERYIPPTNSNEYAEMWSLRGRSLLYDRLIELSPKDGIMLFVYPTKTGARTFMQDYLGPIIDPLLRTVTVVHDLHSDLGRNLGQMSAVNYLDEYNHLEQHLRTYCDVLSERSGKIGHKDEYTVIHAAKENVLLERAVWADDWWIKQEKPRVRDNITKYFRKSKKLPGDEMTGAYLIQEVLEGVSTREYQGDVPRRGVEVGVFVVKKTRST